MLSSNVYFKATTIALSSVGCSHEPFSTSFAIILFASHKVQVLGRLCVLLNLGVLTSNFLALILALPQGVYSIEEARTMKLAGADAVYIRHEVLQGPQATEQNPQVFLDGLRGAMSGDD